MTAVQGSGERAREQLFAEALVGYAEIEEARRAGDISDEEALEAYSAHADSLSQMNVKAALDALRKDADHVRQLKVIADECARWKLQGDRDGATEWRDGLDSIAKRCGHLVARARRPRTEEAGE